MKKENKHIAQWSLPVLVLFLLGMSGCSEECDEPATASSGQKLELLVSPKALPDETAFPDSVFFACGNEAGRYGDIWKATVGSNGRCSFSETRYYPSDDSRIYLLGFAPKGEAAGENLRQYLVDGSEDILITDEQSGSLTDMFWQTGKAFEFSHLLTQLRFRFRCDVEGEERGWKAVGLTVEGLQQEAVLSLADKTLFFSGEETSVPVFDRKESEKVEVLGADWSDVVETVLVQPGAPVSLTVVVEDTAGVRTCFDNLSVSFHEEGGMSLAGTSYLISVTLCREDEISLNVAVAPWKIGAPGGGEIGEE